MVELSEQKQGTRTDEPFTSLHGFTVDDAINLCRKNKVYVNVLGIDRPKHKYLAAVTGGTWHPIPVNQITGDALKAICGVRLRY